MLETFKIMHGMDRLAREMHFSLSHNAQTMRHPIKLSVGRARTHKRKYLFILHVISLWDSLPKYMVMASGQDVFKRGLDTFLEEKSIRDNKPWWVRATSFGCRLS